MSRPLRLVACALALVVGVAIRPSTASAHTEVQRAAPGPGAEVDGRIDQIELEFLDPVQPGLTIAVADGAGDPVAGLEPARLGEDRRVARAGFDALTVAGTYVVTYDYSAPDGARQRASYSFRFTGGGPEGGPVGIDDPDGVGAAGVIGLVAFVLLAVAAGVAGRVRRSAADRDPAGADEA